MSEYYSTLDELRNGLNQFGWDSPLMINDTRIIEIIEKNKRENKSPVDFDTIIRITLMLKGPTSDLRISLQSDEEINDSYIDKMYRCEYFDEVVLERMEYFSENAKINKCNGLNNTHFTTQISKISDFSKLIFNNLNPSLLTRYTKEDWKNCQIYFHYQDSYLTRLGEFAPKPYDKCCISDSFE